MLYASFGLIAASLAPMVAPIEASLGMSHAAMGSVMGAWQLVYIFSAVPCGMLLDRVGGMDPARAGYWATLPTVVGIVGSLLIPRFAIRKRRLYMLMALAAIALAAALLLRFTDPGLLSLGLILQGIARSSLMTLLMLTLVELPEVGEGRAGVASGMFFSAAEIGGVLGPLGIGILYDTSGGFDSSLWSLAGVALLVIAGSLALHRTMRGRRSADF